MRNITLLITGFVLTGCGNAVKTETSAASIDVIHEVSVTADLETPGKVIAATFVPNTVATWHSDIILLTNNGTIYKTNAQSEKPTTIATGSYADIFGFQRTALPGLFLALKLDGSLGAFIEAENEGEYKSIPVSSGGGTISAFCSDSTPQSDFVWVATKDGDLQKLQITVQDTTAVELAVSETSFEAPKTTITSCAVNANDELWVLSENTLLQHNGNSWTDTPYPSSAKNLIAFPGYDGFISSQAPNAPMVLNKAGQTEGLSIINGLSVSGVQSTSFVTVTDANLGSTFNGGAIVAIDDEADRLVLVSREFALREITGE